MIFLLPGVREAPTNPSRKAVTNAYRNDTQNSKDISEHGPPSLWQHLHATLEGNEDPGNTWLCLSPRSTEGAWLPDDNSAVCGSLQFSRWWSLTGSGTLCILGALWLQKVLLLQFTKALQMLL